MARGRIYHLFGDDLTPMDETPYHAEEVLQRLLAKHSDLLAGDQVNPDAPRRWLLIAREAGIPDAPGASDRWSVDHLFVDQDGIPTLVEVKRSSDTRIRREVVGQMLDYAANLLAHWPSDRIEATYRDRFGTDQSNADRELAAFLRVVPTDAVPEAGESSFDSTAAAFWQRVADNLAGKRLRLLFVADVIPPELQRIIEYLNENMVRSEVLGIEVRQFSGGGQTTLVPRVIGRTTASVDVKTTASARSPRHDWDVASFLAACAERTGDGAAAVAKGLLEWLAAHDLAPTFGHGVYGPMYVPVAVVADRPVAPVDLSTAGKIEVLFVALREIPPFDRSAVRHGLKDRLHQIPGVTLPDDMVERASWPSFNAAAVTTPEGFSAFTTALEWVRRQLIEHGEGGDNPASDR